MLVRKKLRVSSFKYLRFNVCRARNGMCPSKNRFDRTIWPEPVGKLFAALSLDSIYVKAKEADKNKNKWWLLAEKIHCYVYWAKFHYLNNYFHLKLRAKFIPHNDSSLSFFIVTVARAVELKHKASLISALTNETSKLFTAAGTAVTFSMKVFSLGVTH